MDDREADWVEAQPAPGGSGAVRRAEHALRMAEFGARWALHDLGNSFHALELRVSFLQSICGSAEEGAETIEALRRIGREARGKLTHFMGALAPEWRPPVERIRLDVALAAAVEMALAVQRPVRLLVDPAVATLPAVRAAAPLVSAALFNIVENALEASSAGGEVRVGAVRRESRAGVVVDDDGPGIPDEDPGQPFHPFFTTKEPPRLGMGLTMVRWGVRQMNGQIRLEPRRPRGTRIEMVLPVA